MFGWLFGSGPKDLYLPPYFDSVDLRNGTAATYVDGWQFPNDLSYNEYWQRAWRELVDGDFPHEIAAALYADHHAGKRDRMGRSPLQMNVGRGLPHGLTLESGALNKRMLKNYDTLTAWHDANPDDDMALIFRLGGLHTLTGIARGGALADDTTQEQWRNMEIAAGNYDDMFFEHVERLKPYPHTLASSYGLAQFAGSSRTREYAALCEEYAWTDSDYYGATAHFLLDRWGGSYGKFKRLIAQMREMLPADQVAATIGRCWISLEHGVEDFLPAIQADLAKSPKLAEEFWAQFEAFYQASQDPEAARLGCRMHALLDEPTGYAHMRARVLAWPSWLDRTDWCIPLRKLKQWERENGF